MAMSVYIDRITIAIHPIPPLVDPLNYDSKRRSRPAMLPPSSVMFISPKSFHPALDRVPRPRSRGNILSCTGAAIRSQTCLTCRAARDSKAASLYFTTVRVPVGVCAGG